MNMLPTRRVIYAKDIMILTGRQKSTCYHLLGKIRQQYNKSRNGFVTVDEFCAYTGMSEKDVMQVMNN